MIIHPSNFLKTALAILLLSNSVLIFYTLKQEKNKTQHNFELAQLNKKINFLLKNKSENQSVKTENVCMTIFIEDTKVRELKPIKIKYSEEVLIIDNIITEVEAIEAPIYEHETMNCGSIVLQEAMPEEGMQSFYNYVSQNLNYPIKARERNIEGEILVSFVVNKKGEIVEVKAKNDIGGGCKEEAERVIRNSKKWIAARQRGKIVPVRLTIPIVFKLEK